MKTNFLSIVLLIFYPSRFIQKATENAIFNEFEKNIQFHKSFPNRQLPEETRQEFYLFARNQTIKIRHSYGKAFLLVIIAIMLSYLTTFLAYPIVGAVSSTVILILQIVASGILLGATVGIVGWEIQTMGGKTLPEKVNRDIFHILYFVGTYILLLSLTWNI